MSDTPRTLVDRIADVLDRWDPAINPDGHRDFDTVAMAEAIVAEVLDVPNPHAVPFRDTGTLTMPPRDQWVQP